MPKTHQATRGAARRAAAAAAVFGAAACNAQSIQQPSSETSITSFSGQGSIPFQYAASDASTVSSINVALVQDDLDFVLANGLLGDADGRYSAVFAPTSGFCGQVALQVTENQGNSSSGPLSQDFTITCGPVQRTRSLSARQEGGGGGGPSGSLTSPSGGTSYESPEGAIQITYQPVTEGGQTFGIDAILVSDFGSYTLTNGLWKANSSQDISANFAIPSGACGPFSLQITEHQFYQNAAISFQAASPSINITCASGSGGNTNATVPSASNSTRTALPTSTGLNTTSTASNSSALPTFTGNITLPIETSTITEPTTIISTVITTFTESGQPGTLTSAVTTTVSPSSPSSSSSSTMFNSTSSTSSSSASSTSSNISSNTSPMSSGQAGGGGGGGDIRTTTVTATPSSSQGNGITTVTITPTTTPTATQSITPERRTSTYTTTEVLVVAQPGRSSITSTRLQTVILVSQTIAAIVQPSQSGGSNGGSAAPANSPPSGAASTIAQTMPWSMTIAVCMVTIALFHRVI